ncbi:efflux RND transporter permease subunit [Sporosalibacterium faouarense]|uniref:efflux RND transporter permease subunit n=1 Tax=Sporosalibacterium faouarense TaxID=516123 RepID=UPI00192C935A|nr:efflux RND transporter permease subunit [Sporosalibacterium faouarense]
MNLSSLAVKRPVTIVMVTLIVILLGVVSLTRIPIDLLPKMEIPVAIVSSSYDGAGPLEMENLVTRPIEQSIATVSSIESVSSISSEGNSIVVAQFNYGTDMDFATLEMREKVDMVKGFLPEDSSDPMVMTIDPNAMPMMQVALSEGDSLESLQTIAEDTIKPRLERLEGVASVDIVGGYEKEIEIKLNESKLKGYGLSLDYIAQIIGAENLNMPVGEVGKGTKDLTVRTVGEFQSIEEIRELPIALQTGGTIRLSDVADISFGYKDVSSMSKTNGEESINITIQKESGSNTVSVADNVNQELDNLRQEISGIKIDTVLDQSEYIKQSIDSVLMNGLLGGILAILILFIFLRNFRTTIIIGTAIPVSIIATFTLIYFNDITLNLMTLGGLALGIGMLVDNSIVVLENIYRFRQEGYSRKEASIKGAKEVGMAVTASTLTTVAVFLPIVFVEGIASMIFKELALTVTMSLLASLVVSLTLIPMLSSKFLKVDMQQGEKHKSKFRLFSFIYDIFDKLFFGLEKLYKRLLGFSLKHRLIVIIAALVIFGGSMASILSVGAEFLPSTDEGQFSISVNLPVGAELEETNDIITEVEGKLENIDEIDILVSNVGSGGSMTMSVGGSGSNTGTIDGILIPLDERDRSVFEVADQVRDLVRDIPGAEISVNVTSTAMMGGLSGAPLQISIKGDEIDTLEDISKDFVDIVNSVEGTEEVESSIGEGIPEVQIVIDRIKASQYGLTAAQIASAVKSNIDGRVATRYKYEGSEIDIVVKGDDTFSQSISNMEQSSITTPTGATIPLSQVAKAQIERQPNSIDREDQVRVVTVSGQISGRDLKTVSDEVQAKFDEYDMPAGYSYEFGGENEELTDAFSDLSLALILAVILVFMILASQFESLLHPFTIILSVPIAFAGGALGLFVTGKTLSVPAIIGFIVLAGIVVNNAIVLVDYINTRRESGEQRNEAIKNAGPIRLRPILMTTLTTVLGLFPLALGVGEGAEIQAPMAIAVIGGLLLSTLLTLVFVPVVYTISDDLSRFFNRRILKRNEKVEA